jgi:hypothetical protein
MIYAAAASKLPLIKIQEMELITNEFQLDMATVQGYVNQPPIEPPRYSILQTRAALPILLIAMVCFRRIGLISA